ncbi:hypothetical protein CARUB_v10002340mg [Capsella rubella]|uniref:Uncharacterized protein n=1 Tax=Capsella rubella TaxID=81985 RepID=R0GY90_9BRAS|nr:uncharacterized protein LOC17883107 [Capsella rubella]EOA21864.1 hypothetical protein CARUB_v10002340mg [Capsella rubella]
MTSSMVSSMALFLLLLLVFPHMDKALGAQEGVQKQSGEDTYQPNRRGFPPIRVPGIPGRTPKFPPIPKCLPKHAHVPFCKGKIEFPPPPPKRP